METEAFKENKVIACNNCVTGKTEEIYTLFSMISGKSSRGIVM